MSSEDWFLRLDPYNFNTEEEWAEFHAQTEKPVDDKKNKDTKVHE